jgi:hypothetical protein
MKVIGAIALTIGVVFSLLYISKWVSLVADYGVTQALKISFATWPDNAVQLTFLAISVIFTGGGLALLGNKSN